MAESGAGRDEGREERLGYEELRKC